MFLKTYAFFCLSDQNFPFLVSLEINSHFYTIDDLDIQKSNDLVTSG